MSDDLLVEARGLVKRYPPRERRGSPFVAVDGIDFALRRGEAFGFLGPNGAGKSSTMRMIACVSPPTGGTLRVLGMDPVVDGRRIRARLGVVPQDDALDRELSVRENLLIYGRYLLHGHALFMAVRVTMSAAAFLAVMVALGAAKSTLVLLALPAATLTAMAFALPAAAWAVTLSNVEPVGRIYKWVVMPLYLFSGTFFAVTQLPGALRPVVYAAPLWHGVDLCRSLSLGTATWAGSLGHVAYLTAMGVAGYLLARRNYRRHLHA